MSDDTIEAIRRRWESADRYIKGVGFEPTQAHKDLGTMITMAETLQDLAKPIPAVKKLAPLVVYFENEADRQGFVQVVREAFPTWKTVKTP